MASYRTEPASVRECPCKGARRQALFGHQSERTYETFIPASSRGPAAFECAPSGARCDGCRTRQRRVALARARAGAVRGADRLAIARGTRRKIGMTHRTVIESRVGYLPRAVPPVGVTSLS